MAKRAKPLVLCDSGVFFRIFREDKKMWKEIDHIGFERLALSSITKAEAYYGMKKSEVTRTKALLNLFKTISLSKEISDHLEQMMYQYRQHHPQIPDCLIAATAITIGAELFTLNRQDFVYYNGLTLYSPKLKH